MADGPHEQTEFEKLAEQIHKLPPLTKPPLGPSPRAKQKVPQAISASHTDATKESVETPGAPRGLFPVIQVPKGDGVDVENSLDVYERSLDLARANDVVAWRRLVRQISVAIAANLQAWIAKRTANMPKVESDLPEFALQAIGIYSPLFAVALAGVESSEPQFSQQSSILDEILHPKGWQRNSFSLIVDIPQTIAFAYQALHGALCLETRQLPLALNLAGMQLASGRGDAVVKLYQRREIVGWPSGLPNSSAKVWDFLIDLPNKQTWLNEPFGDAVRLKISALAYYECLSVLELTNEIANGKLDEIVKTPAENTWLDVPVHLAKYTDEEAMRAHALLLDQKAQVASIWRSRAIRDDVILNAWPHWADRHYYWLRKESWRGFSNQRFDKLIADVLS